MEGEDYPALVRDARAKAVALLGPDRTYYLSLEDVHPEAETVDAAGHTEPPRWWSGTARITTPHEPAF